MIARAARLACAYVTLACAALLCTPARLRAQVDPRGNIRTLTTAHFRVHYPVALDSIARRAAFLAEGAWTGLSRELVAPRAPVDMLIEDNVDLSNGFAGVFPVNRITIYAVPPVDVPELRFHDDWLRLVITHELTHVFHLDRARGLWSLGRAVFGRNQALFPNISMPSWVTEGIAVHYESKLTGSGRIVSTESRQVARAAARAGDLRGPDAWSAATTQFPGGQIPYAWGSQLIDREASRSDSAMRKFIDYTAYFPIPYLLNRAAKRGFGETFSRGFDAYRDSLRTNVAVRKFADDKWTPIAGLDTLGNRAAAHPRYRDDGVLLWVASNGKEPAGLYSARPQNEMLGSAGIPPTPSARVDRRNSLDVNVPIGIDSVLYSQYDFADPYTIRNDLYLHDANGDRRITHGARLVSPDVRRTDRAIVAVQYVPGGTRIVRVGYDGTITPITVAGSVEWAEPRWSERLSRIAAVQILPTGVERIVMMDTLGTILRIVAEARAVMASPSFTTLGDRLMWTSDRSGRMQIEVADVGMQYGAPDTTWRAEVRSFYNVSTAVYQPTFSPKNNLKIAALIYRDNGYVVATAPFDLSETFNIADSAWYSASADGSYARTRAIASPTGAFAGASSSYHALRQLVPRYWEPLIGQARDGGSNYGAFTSSDDILGRHSYSASVQVNPRNGETDGAFAYSYAGLGVPVVNASFAQSWDATFRITDSLRHTLGYIGRRVDNASLALAWSVPRVRWALNYSVGAAYELRHFTATVDSLLGASGSLLRTGTHYPSLFVSGGFSTLARGATGISAQQGFAATSTVSVRKRDGGANTTSWRGTGALRAFQSLPLALPGFARHVVASRIAGGMTDARAPSEFALGGVSGVVTEVVPGVSIGDPARTFPLRGFAPGVERGLRAVSASAEYRAPLTLVGRGAGLFPVFLDRLSVSAFGDAGRAWCTASQRGTTFCPARVGNDAWLASVGAELIVDLALQYDVPYRLRFGVAKPVAAYTTLSRKPSAYVTLGAFF